MEGLQLAQIMADLSSLNATEPAAASALVNASKTLDYTTLSSPPSASAATPRSSLVRPELADPRRANSSASFYDLFQRLASPPIIRSNSTAGSIPGTPRRDADHDDELERMTSMMGLYELRAKLRHQDNMALLKARSKVAELAEKQRLQTVATAAGLEMRARADASNPLSSLLKSPRQ